MCEMANYFNQNYNIITFYEYYKNIKTYQFSALLEIKGTDYITALKKDFRNEFFNYLLINELDFNNENNLKNFKNPFDYIIVDNKNIEKFCKYYNIFTWQIIDFTYYLDMPEIQKFDFVHNVIRSVDFNYIIKIKRDFRDLEKYPIEVDEIDDQLMFTKGYEYNNLFN